LILGRNSGPDDSGAIHCRATRRRESRGWPQIVRRVDASHSALATSRTTMTGL